MIELYSITDDSHFDGLGFCGILPVEFNGDDVVSALSCPNRARELRTKKFSIVGYKQTRERLDGYLQILALPPTEEFGTGAALLGYYASANEGNKIPDVIFVENNALGMEPYEFVRRLREAEGTEI